MSPAIRAVMRTLLDPTNDIVFKIMFSQPENTDLLISLLTAVLRPGTRISSVVILNPELPKDAITDRGVILDVHVRFADGSRVNVEMQSRRIEGMRERSAYHLARMYGSELDRGDEYFDLEPCVGVFLLGYNELPGARFHSTFELREIHDHVLLTDQIRIHFVELLELQRACPEQWADQALLADWVRFFRPADAREREELAMKDRTFAKARHVLETLSDDEQVRYWARAREEGEVLYRHELAATRKAGREEGKAEGLAEGKAEGQAEGRAGLLLEMIEDRFGPVGDEVAQRIRSGSVEEIRRWGSRLVTAASVEELFSSG